MPQELPPGPIWLSIDYTADFRTGAEGLFHAKVGEDWYAWTQMEPIDARRVFPCFDDPGFKTPFTISVIAPTGTKVFSNAPEVSTSRASRGNTLHNFAPTKPLPTYLVAIAVGPFDVVEATAPPNAVRTKPLPMRIIATRGQTPRMQLAASEAPKLLGLLEEYMGIPYPFEKLDLAASPAQSGAMENAGLILFADTYILMDPQPRLSQLRNFGIVTAHEMSHQWFGDLVTPSWWTDIWLNESFAEWMGNKVAALWRPDLDVPAGELSGAFSAMEVDALGRGRPIHQEITENTQIESAFDDITYLKGAQVLSMFESLIGPDKFKEGVRQHLRSYAYANATADEFFRSLAAAVGDPKIVPAMRTFIDQTGVPVVRVHDEPAGLTLTQARYHPLGVGADSKELWNIPVCLARAGNHSCTLLETATATIQQVPGEEPLVPNADGAGYYRFRLDDSAWNRLISSASRLSAREAMAVGDSVLSDFEAGTGTFAHVVGVARSLSAHPEAVAATMLAGSLRGLARSMLSEDDMPGYRRLMGSIYGLPLASVGLEVRRGAYAAEPAPTQLLRQSLVPLVALEARDPPLRLKLLNAAEASLGGTPDALDVAFRRTAFSVAVQERGAPFMTQLKDALVKSTDPLFREDATAALASVDTPALASVALELAYAPGLQSLETLRMLEALAREPAANATVVNFVNANFDRVLQSMPGFARPRLPEVLFGSDCSTGDVAKVDAWASTKRKALGGGELELSQTKERIQRCVALKRARGDEIAAALGMPAAAASR
jgi:hypothetical protein